MSMTLKFRTTFDLTLVASSEKVAEVEQARAELRELVASDSKEELKTLKGLQKYLLDVLVGPGSTEEVLMATFKAVMQEHIKSLKDETEEGCTARIGNISTKQIVEAPKASLCNTCAHNLTCALPRGLKPVASCRFYSDRAGQLCPLHPDDKACTTLCKRFLESN